MFDQLDLSPMMLLMLLLYGLLIAVVLVLWTALDLRRRNPRGSQPHEAERNAPEPAGRPAVRRDAVQTQQLPEANATKAARRAADSDSVVSYSVRPRVTSGEPAPPAPAVKPAAAAEPEVPERATQAQTLARPIQSEPLRTADVDFPVGRGSRQLKQEKSRTVTPVRPPPVREDRTGEPERRRSEDAFERFLRSSGNDNDDY